MNWTELMIAIKKGLIPSKKELVDGTTKVGNADKLDGHGAEYFAPKTDLANYIKADGSNAWVSSVNDLNAFYTGITVVRYCENVPNDNWWLVISGGEGGTTVQTAFHLHGIETPKQRYCAGGSWSKWFDLNKDYLPLTGGGEVTRGDAIPIRLKNTASGTCYTRFSGKDGVLGFLGMGGENAPTYMDKDGNGNSLLHTGNYLNYALPLDGTRAMTHTLPIGSVSLESGATMLLTNKKRSAYLQVTADGRLALVDNTNGIVLLEVSADGQSSTFRGTATGNYPLSGGKLNATASTGYTLGSTGGSAVGSTFYNADGTKAGGIGVFGAEGVANRIYLSMHPTADYDSANGLAIYPDNITWKNKGLHHDGNSAKVHIGTSAPSDTSALWVW